MPDEHEAAPDQARLEEDPETDLVVVREEDGDGEEGPQSQVDEPDKLLRLAGQVRGLLNQAWDCELDEAGRERLADIHNKVLGDLRELVSGDLREELEGMRLPDPDEPPSGAELRVYQAQLGGWLEGLFHGIQASMASRQAAQQQQQMMQQLQQQGSGGGPTPGGSGQYL